MPGFGAVGQLAVGQIGGQTTVMSAAVGAFVVSGQAAAFRARMASGAGAIILSGASADLRQTIAAGAAAFALTGQAAVFQARVVADTQTYVLGGQAATYTVGINCGFGSFLLTGMDIDGVLGTLTSTHIVHLPIDCVLAGQQPYDVSGRTWEVPPHRVTEKSFAHRSGARQLSAQKSTSVTRTDHRGYD